MAWLDDRAWAHPKIVGLTAPAFRAWVNGILYSSGMELRGVLAPAHQKLVGATSSIKQELIEAGLWDALIDGGVEIHDWNEHNARRDERKVKERERKRKEYQSRKSRAGETAEKPAEVAQESRVLTGDRVTVGEPNGSPAAGQRERNPIWDALVEVFGEPSTDTARSLRGKVCSSLTRAGATPEEIISRAKSWPRHFEHATLTETALEKHWDALGRRPLRLEQR